MNKHTMALLLSLGASGGLQAASLTVQGNNCGVYSGITIDANGNVKANVPKNVCVKPTTPVVTPPVTPPVVVNPPPTSMLDYGAGISYPIALRKSWGALAYGPLYQAKGSTAFVWRAPVELTAAENRGSLRVAPADVDGAYVTVSISTKPNDFTSSVMCQQGSATKTDIRWTVNKPMYGYCTLTKGVVYYVNVVHLMKGNVQTCPAVEGCFFTLENSPY